MTSYGTVVSYPVPPYTNPPIQPYFYQPSQFFISSITLGQTTTVTTTVNHNYVVSQLVRLLIPPQFGCVQLNEASGYVVNIPAANQVTLSIYSLNGDPFVSSAAASHRKYWQLVM